MGYGTLPVSRMATLYEGPVLPEQGYLSSVALSLRGFEALPADALKSSKAQLRGLLSSLRATHQTLVSALKPFSIGDARKFFEEFDSFAQEFSTLYHGGQIPHTARTHCREVEDRVRELESRIPNNSPGMREISSLCLSVVMQDQDVIVPLMVELLDRAQREVTIIGQAIRDRDFRKAVFMKERLWFEVKGIYQELDVSLTKMSDLTARL